MTAPHSPVAKALRAAGFLPLPRLWVRPEELDAIMSAAARHEPTVNAIRAQVRAERDRAAQVDAAWQNHKVQA